MAKYSFKSAHAADVYSLVAESVAKVTFIPSANGRIIVQDAADAAPAQDATGWMEVAAGRPYALDITGLKVYYRPWGEAAVVNGVKK